MEKTINKADSSKKAKNTNQKNIKTKNKNSTSALVENKKSSKVIKLKSDFNSQNFICIKKLKNTVIVVILIFILLLIRIGFIQFVDGNYLSELAYKQQSINQIISPKRGNIYDSTGNTLATSAQVDTITINPSKIKDKNENGEKTKALKEKVAKGLSDIFSLDYNETLEKVNSKNSVETIAKKVEKEKIDELKTWMKDNNITVGINIDEDTKRYYPYNNVASNVIGCTGSDNQGLTGIEWEWESTLAGTPGKIVSSKGSDQEEIPNAEETYIAAENGSDLTLTIDLNIQTIVEKYLKQAVEDNSCTKGGNAIVMNPQNGDILAMATYPDYNLNEPFTPNSTVAKTYDSLSSEEKNTAILTMWKNKSVSDLYEPGSTFKVITSAIALEENITTTDKENDFNCIGHEKFVDGAATKIIKCWKYYDPHGSQTLRKALMNSCNPAFMQLGKRIGAPTLYKYYKAFGLFDKTNSGLYAEENSIFFDLEDVKSTELATISFGQRFKITPLQLITAISSIANDGVLMQPRIVKEIKNTDTGAVTQIEPVEVRKVISKQTAAQVKSMMESVVLNGTGQHAAVSGYSIGGKSGTSEPLEGKEEEGYVASFVAISPIEDTKVCILVTLYDPNHGTENHQGGQVAGPVVSQILSEVLPILGVPSDNTNVSTSNDASGLKTVPEIRNKTVTEAEKILKDAGFTTKISVQGDKNSLLVVDQVPKPGISLAKGSVIMLYSEENTTRTSVTVPDLKGMSTAQATNALKSKNLNVTIEGTSGIVVSQDPPKDSPCEEGTVVKITIKENLTDGH